METIKLIECPRDAWQGLRKLIPTNAKVGYLHKLIELGFTHLDAVSFVSPQHVAQMADSEHVMESLSATSVLAAQHPARQQNVEMIGLVLNEKGLERALSTPGVTTLGYPYSVSANFRRQNANMSQSESRTLVERILRATRAAGVKVVVYISMAFGNPFGEPWGPAVTAEALSWLEGLGVKTVSLADTVGVATAQQIGDLYREVRRNAEGVELGVHLHSRPDAAAEKVIAAYEAGCRRFDCALTGMGGCPFAGDELVGNIPTEVATSALAARGVSAGIEPWAMLAAVEATQEMRREYTEN